MKLLREYIRVLLEQDQGSKGSLVVVDIQPEYESNTPFDIGDMLRTAAEDYSRVLFLFNGEDTLGMVSDLHSRTSTSKSSTTMKKFLMNCCLSQSFLTKGTDSSETSWTQAFVSTALQS